MRHSPYRRCASCNTKSLRHEWKINPSFETCPNCRSGEGWSDSTHGEDQIPEKRYEQQLTIETERRLRGKGGKERS